MKVTVCMVHVGATKPEYEAGERRLLASYLKYDPGHAHDLVVINRYTEPAEDDLLAAEFRDLGNATFLQYQQGGWDCGAWQFAGANIDTDLLVCFNSSTYITGHGWLKLFVEAVEAHGEGLYGPMASLEINPHIRTPCMVFQPHIIRNYPAQVLNREDTYRFEVFGFNDCPNFTMWVRSRGWQTRLVAWDGDYDLPAWRSPANIFRRGDQSNLIVRDRHADAYQVSDEAGKRTLERLADG